MDTISVVSVDTLNTEDSTVSTQLRTSPNSSFYLRETLCELPVKTLVPVAAAALAVDRVQVWHSLVSRDVLPEVHDGSRVLSLREICHHTVAKAYTEDNTAIRGHSYLLHVTIVLSNAAVVVFSPRKRWQWWRPRRQKRRQLAAQRPAARLSLHLLAREGESVAALAATLVKGLRQHGLQLPIDYALRALALCLPQTPLTDDDFEHFREDLRTLPQSLLIRLREPILDLLRLRNRDWRGNFTLCDSVLEDLTTRDMTHLNLEGCLFIRSAKWLCCFLVILLFFLCSVCLFFFLMSVPQKCARMCLLFLTVKFVAVMLGWRHLDVAAQSLCGSV